MSHRKAKGIDTRTFHLTRSRPVRIAALGCCAAALFVLGIYTAEFLSRRYSPPGPADPFFLVDSPRATTAPQLPPQAAEPLPALSFFDTLSGKKQAEEPGVLPARKTHERQASRPEPPPVAGAAAPDAQQAAEHPGVVYTIQLGSFESARAARDFSVLLAEKGYEPYIQTIEVPGKGMVYRVRMGRLNSLEEAQQVAKDFERNEKKSVLITSR